MRRAELSLKYGPSAYKISKYHKPKFTWLWRTFQILKLIFFSEGLEQQEERKSKIDSTIIGADSILTATNEPLAWQLLIWGQGNYIGNIETKNDL